MTVSVLALREARDTILDVSENLPPTVTDRYILAGLIGEGGMGRIWKAVDRKLRRDVAIKEIVAPRGLADEELWESRERSLREARAIAKLNHVNVVRIFDVFVVGDGLPWIVMEYVPSRSLHETITADGPLSPGRTAEIGLGVLSALRAAHRAGIMHRDVKPANVLLGNNGRIVLTDFGLATAVEDPQLTSTGVVLGSPAYLSPERAALGTVGPEGDLWSLGATLFTAVEGSPPYARPSSMMILSALATEPPPVAKHAGALAPLLEGLLRKDPDERIDAETAELLLRGALRESSGDSRESLVTMRLGSARQAHPRAKPASVARFIGSVDDPGPGNSVTSRIFEGTKKASPPSRSRRARLVGAGLLAVLLLAGVAVVVPWATRGGPDTISVAPLVLGSLPAELAPSDLPQSAVATSAPVNANTASAAPSGPNGHIVGLGGKCVGLSGDRATDGARVVLDTCDTTTGAQQWTVLSNGGLYNAGECLTPTNGGTTNGTSIIVMPCDGSTAQKWTALANGNLVNGKSGMCVNDPGDSIADGTQLQLYTCNANAVAEQWLLPPASSDSPTAKPAGTMGHISGPGGLCLTPAGDKAVVGVSAELRPCGSATAQNWVAAADGRIWIDGFCLTTFNAATASKTRLALASCDGSTAQRWSATASSQLLNAKSQTCAYDSANGTLSGSVPYLFGCFNGSAEVFTLPAAT